MRVVSSMVMVPAAAGAVFLGGASFVIVVLILAGLMAWEWGTLVARPARAVGARLIIAVLGIVAVLLVALRPELPQPAILVGAVVLAVSLAVGLRLAPAVWTGFAVLAIAGPAMALIWLRGLPELGAATVLWVLATVVLTDTGGYVVGRAVGGPKLWQAVSPRKTWSGAVGGVVFAVFVALIATGLVGGARLSAVLPVAVAISVVAQIGDLAESAVKRHFKVKDSSGLIPGHGGVLDRFDGHLAAIPTLALMVWLHGDSVLAW